MLKFFSSIFSRKPLKVENILQYPEGKRYYKDYHIIRKNLIDEEALKIIHRLNKFGYKAYLVGGGVRDILLGRKPKDFDVVTSATPNQIKGVFNNCRIIGKRFKIVHVLFKGNVIEVSTFRSLPEYKLGKPKSDQDYLIKRDNKYGSAKEDAARRDFSINALYYDPRNDSIIDFVGGFEDIKNKILRAIGDPEISFKEDPVRMLRAVKFSVIHGLDIDRKTKQAIKAHRTEITKASTSRMLEEYNKIFRTWKTSIIFQGLAENHLLEVLFKEVADNLKKKSEWKEDFLETSVGKRLVIADRMLSEREELTSVIFFAILFSDLVSDALDNENQNIVQSIRNSIEPICKRLEIPKRDKDRLLKIFASQARFLKTEDENAVQNEFFRKKDFFYEAFMIFKINAIANNDEKSIQAAFFWEISTRNRPKPSQRGIHLENSPHTSRPKMSHNRQGRKRFPDKKPFGQEGTKIVHERSHERTNPDVIKPVSSEPANENLLKTEGTDKPKQEIRNKRNKNKFRRHRKMKKDRAIAAASSGSNPNPPAPEQSGGSNETTGNNAGSDS
ncbi:MAG: polynucleotide adenylyltransferase PcnB [Leptospira sp.]|nr:polynucleotide adenylyltransferase PcnB [Leptospira sp.]